MPVAYVDIPTGVNHAARETIFEQLYEAIHEAWPIPDTRVLIREWPSDAVSQDGRIEDVAMRPICTLAVPPGLELDAKRRLIRQISDTIGEACGREIEEIRLPSGTTIRNNWVLTFFWELPLDKVALGDLLATENPLVLENLPPQAGVREEIVAEDRWGQILFYDGWNSLELRWLPSTADATDAELRETMELFAKKAVNRRPHTLIVDTTDFQHRWGDGMMEWREAEIIPRYNEAGVAKLAFIANVGYPGPTVEAGAEPAPEGPATFPSGWFKTRKAAYQWLAS